MQKQSTPKHARVSIVPPTLGDGEPVEQIDLAISILRVVHAALRDQEFLQWSPEKDIAALADVVAFALDKLRVPREALNGLDTATPEGGDV